MMLTDQEKINLSHIEDLNQRGGRMLSVVDLIEARTLSLDAAAHLMCLIGHGASFLTGAVPGGAGKTTVMAALLGFLPPGSVIIPTATGSVPPLPRNPQNVWVLAHEIGSGPYFGYIWGEAVHEFIALPERGAHFVSCLHADTPEQMAEILCNPPNDVPQSHLRSVDFAAFIGIYGRFGRYERLVKTIAEPADDGNFKLVFLREHRGAELEQKAESPSLQRLAERNGITADEMQARRNACRVFIQQLLESGRRYIDEVRANVLEFYSGQGWFSEVR